MPELTIGFRSLPEGYQQVIHLAQDTYEIAVAPLKLLVGGWSGAIDYLVSVSSNETRRVEVEANLEFIRSALSETELTAAKNKGKAMTLEDALAFASEE